MLCFCCAFAMQTGLPHAVRRSNSLCPREATPGHHHTTARLAVPCFVHGSESEGHATTTLRPCCALSVPTQVQISRMGSATEGVRPGS